MFRRLLVIASALGSILLAACGGETEGPASKAQRRFLSIGTAPPGGAFFVVGGALAEVLNEHSDDSWQVTAEATKGSQENLRRLKAGELELALSNAAITYFAVRGEAGWEESFPIRGVMTLAPNVALFLAGEDSTVGEIADLKGKRVVVGPAGAGFKFFLGPILGAHGLTYDDFNPLYNTQAGAAAMLGDGSAAAAFLGGAVPTASITQATASQQVRFVPFDDAAVSALVEKYPFFDRAVIPAGTYRGQDEDFHGLNVGSMHLVTSAAQDEDLVYRVTRAIYENRAEVVERHAAGKAIRPQVVVRQIGTPFHPGAIRYYREIGIWPGGETSPDG